MRACVRAFRSCVRLCVRVTCVRACAYACACACAFVRLWGTFTLDWVKGEVGEAPACRAFVSVRSDRTLRARSLRTDSENIGLRDDERVVPDVRSVRGVGQTPIAGGRGPGKMRKTAEIERN